MYTVVGFPEIQKYQMRSDFNDAAVFLGSDAQVEKFGDSAWLIPTEWTNSIPSELAFSFSVKAGFTPLKMVSGYLISQKSDREYCYHLVTDVCLEDGHYMFSSPAEAERSLLVSLFFKDIQSADLVGINGENLQLTGVDIDDESFFLTEYAGDEDREAYDYKISDLPFDTVIEHTNDGEWKIETDLGTILNVKCIRFTQEGFC